ncbi:hypothetical protein [Streptomyces sp. NPDC047097]|uniref:hypothetical protein n=1 Tax=Streptomyces sp. NPDC047097 TaxID=3155260 RepID=UPI0033C03387
MTAYWGSFVHGLAPRSADSTAMPEQTSRPGQVLRLRTAAAGGDRATGRLAAEHRCDLWNGA